MTSHDQYSKIILIFLQGLFLLLVDVRKEIEVGEEDEEDGRVGHNDLKRKENCGRTQQTVFNLL